MMNLKRNQLESFGFTGAGPVNSFENIISKIEEIEKRVSNKDLDNFRTHKESLIRMLSSHEVNIYMSMCLHLSVCPAWCMSVS